MPTYVRNIYRPEQAGLTEQQELFVNLLVDNGDIEAAARGAGYSMANADGTLMRLCEHPRVALAIRLRTMQRLQSRAPMALHVVEQVMSGQMRDGRIVDPKLQHEAAKTWLDRAGYVPPKAGESDDGRGDALLSELSPKALEALIGRLEQEKGDRAKPITLEAEASPDLEDLLG